MVERSCTVGLMCVGEPPDEQQDGDQQGDDPTHPRHGLQGTVFCNRFWGYVVLDSVNMADRDEDRILDQIYKSKYFRAVIIKIKDSKSDWGKCIFKEIQHSTTRNS